MGLLFSLSLSLALPRSILAVIYFMNKTEGRARLKLWIRKTITITIKKEREWMYIYKCVCVCALSSSRRAYRQKMIIVKGWVNFSSCSLEVYSGIRIQQTIMKYTRVCMHVHVTEISWKEREREREKKCIRVSLLCSLIILTTSGISI